MANYYHSQLTGSDVHPPKGDSRVGDYTLADTTTAAYAVKNAAGSTMFSHSTSATIPGTYVFSGIGPLGIVAGTAGQAAPTAASSTFQIYTARSVVDTYTLRAMGPDGTIYDLAPSVPTGTDNLTYSINADATSNHLENPILYMYGGTAPASPLDILRTRLIQDSAGGTFQIYTERNRNSAGYSTIATQLQIGKSGDTSNNLGPTLTFHDGNGTIAKTAVISFSGNTGVLTVTPYATFAIATAASVNGTLGINNTSNPLTWNTSNVTMGSTAFPTGNITWTATANGAAITIPGTLTQLLSGLSGATVDTTTASFPANSLALGVSIRITTAVTGATSFNVGTAANATLFGTVSTLTLGTTGVFIPTAYSPFTSSTAVRLTAVGSNFTGGAVRVAIHYVSLTAPTS